MTPGVGETLDTKGGKKGYNVNVIRNKCQHGTSLWFAEMLPADTHVSVTARVCLNE